MLRKQLNAWLLASAMTVGSILPFAPSAFAASRMAPINLGDDHTEQLAQSQITLAACEAALAAHNITRAIDGGRQGIIMTVRGANVAIYSFNAGSSGEILSAGRIVLSGVVWLVSELPNLAIRGDLQARLAASSAAIDLCKRGGFL